MKIDDLLNKTGTTDHYMFFAHSPILPVIRIGLDDMSPSTRKSPICGITIAGSAKADKAANHRKFRRAVRVAPNQGADLLPHERELVNPRSMAKTRAPVLSRRERIILNRRVTENVTSIKIFHVEVSCRVSGETVVSPLDGGRTGFGLAEARRPLGATDWIDCDSSENRPLSGHRHDAKTGGSHPRARRTRAVARFWYSPCLRRLRSTRPRCGRVGSRVPLEPK